ncbi:MAG: hypothetical protein HZA93_22445 [Verrucomicrobia bacterium]|nr:hypothetical protein [Verrucomicrobiota bacterium]
MPGLSDAIQALKTTAVDLTSLEVITLTGDLSASVSGDADKIVDWTKIVADAKTAGGKVTLVATTKIALDGDAVQYVTSQPVPPGLIDAHKAAVESGQKVRGELVNFALGIMQKL